MPANHLPLDPLGLETRASIQRRYGQHPQGWFHWLFDQLDLPSSLPILDLGSGPAIFWQANRARVPLHWQITLADRSLDMLRQSIQLARLPQVTGHVLLDAASLPFASGSFAAILAIGLLDLIRVRQPALAEIRRVLAHGGRLYASAGSQAHLKELAHLLRQFAPAAHLGGLAETFGLENGREQLLASFSQVDLRVFRDTLTFDQPDPVLAYIFSEGRLRAMLTPHQRAPLEQAVRAQLDQHGPLRVTVEKGVFIAS